VESEIKLGISGLTIWKFSFYVKGELLNYVI